MSAESKKSRRNGRSDQEAVKLNGENIIWQSKGRKAENIVTWHSERKKSREYCNLA